MEELAIISTILDKATPELSKFLLVDTSFLEDLVAEEVITSEQKAQIEVIEIKQDKVRKLLTMIENKRSYYGFVRRLNRDTTKELYDFMKDLEKKHGLHGTVQHARIEQAAENVASGSASASATNTGTCSITMNSPVNQTGKHAIVEAQGVASGSASASSATDTASITINIPVNQREKFEIKVIISQKNEKPNLPTKEPTLFQRVSAVYSWIANLFYTYAIGRVDRQVEGSVHLYVRFSKQQELEKLWKMYEDGSLKAELTNVLLTAEPIEVGYKVELEVSIQREDYLQGLEVFLQQDNQMSSPSTSANAAAQGSRPFRDQEPATYPPADGSDVMISYQWDSQQRMLQVRDELKKRGLTVWIDVEKMAGNIYDRMAAGVKGAKVVLVCYSKKYEESENCKKEAEFAVQQKKRVIPLKSDDYVPDNWLGLHFGAHLYHKVDTEENLKNNINGLVNEIKGVAPSIPASQPVSPSSSFKDQGDAPHIPSSQSVSPSSSFTDQGDAPHIPSSQSVSPSSSFKDQEISNTDVLYVTKVFSNAALEDLCIQLRLDPNTDIANAKQGYPQLSTPQARELLHLWLNRQEQPPKRSDLITVMEENDDWKAWVTTIKEKWK